MVEGDERVIKDDSVGGLDVTEGDSVGVFVIVGSFKKYGVLLPDYNISAPSTFLQT